jgi:hypothetical protein
MKKYIAQKLAELSASVPPNQKHDRIVARGTSTRPEFIRLPSGKESCPHTGFSRTGLYNLTVPCKANSFRPAVPAKGLRKPGNLRGIWLIPYEALITYIKNLPTPGMRGDGDQDTK